ncbi:MAG: hypothetical protein M1832_000234 [Thelocarpon impressellum]|nr:MAG: hypothetical protein M1832_000234 [Thelocarpon impressellum]
MCILEVFKDVYPNNVETRNERLLTCAASHNNQACPRLIAVERAPRLLPFPEAPPATMATMATHDGRNVARAPAHAPSTTSSTSTSRKPGRKYWKRGEHVVLEIDLPFLRRKSKKEREDEDDLVWEVADEPRRAHAGHGGHIPVPPPAPMPPRHRRRPSDASPAPPEAIIPPPPYLDRRPERRRSHTELPLVIQVAPPSSPPRPPRRRSPPPSPGPSPRRVTFVDADGWSSPSERDHAAARDPLLRRHEERERRRRAREVEELRRREADEERRQADIRAERAQQKRERDETRRRNVEQERAQQERERQRYAQQQQQQRRQSQELPSPTSLPDALLRGQRVAQPLGTPVTVDYGHEAAHDSDDDGSWTSAPGDILITERPRRPEGMREHGERVLEAAGRRWEDEERMRARNEEARLREEARRRAVAGGLGRRATRAERVVWGDERADGAVWR